MLIPFSPPPGLNSDDTSFKREGRWADGSNVRFVDGAPQVIGEYTKVFSNDLTGTIRSLFPFTRSSAVSIAYGTASKLYVGSGIAAPSDRTPAGIGSAIDYWSLQAWGSTLLASPGGGKLFEQSRSGTATEIVNAPDQITCMLVTPERQVLAIGCNEEASGTFNGLCIRGCDIEDYTDWTTTSTNNAFEHILDGSGTIIGARHVGPYVAVWTDNALYLGQFIGDPGQTFRFDKVTENCGLVGARAHTSMDGMVYWLTKDLRLLAWSPGSTPAVVPNPLSREFILGATGTPVTRARMILSSAQKYGELWISNVNVSGCYAVNVTDGTWFKLSFTPQAILSDDLFLGADTNANLVSNTWAAIGANIHAMDCGIDTAGEGPTSWFIQSADQYFDNSQRRMMVRSFQPDLKDAAGAVPGTDVSLTLEVRDRPQSDPVTKGPYVIAAGASKKDLRASGKIVAVTLGQSANVDRELRIGKCLFDVVPLGER